MRSKLRGLLLIPRFLRTSAEGFSLVGVMVSAVVGLIVVGGITNLFVNMNSQIKQVENRADLRNVTTLIQSALQDQTGCHNTLHPFKNQLWNNVSGSGKFDFGIIKNVNNDTVFDLSTAATRQSLESKYGLTASVTLRAQCVSSSCKDCSVSSNWTGTPATCDNSWSISLISQSRVRGVTVFNKPQHLATVRVSFNNFTDPLKPWDCNGIALAPIFAASGVADCINVKQAYAQVGCGSTQKNPTNFSIALGFNAGGQPDKVVPPHTTASVSTYIGYNTGPSSTGPFNNFVGSQAGSSNTKGGYNNFFGYKAGHKNTEGDNNNFYGYQAGYSNTKGDNNNFFGYKAGYSNTEGEGNSFYGHQTGYSNTKGDNNSFYGYQAGYKNTEGEGNSFYGYQTGYSNIKADNNSFFGYQAGYSNTKGEKNSFFGYWAGYANTEGDSNTFVGFKAGRSNTKGDNNSFYGYEAGRSNSEGDNNSFFGFQTGGANSKGDDNSFFGHHAGGVNTTGSRNVFLGTQAGFKNTTGSDNIFIGSSAAYHNNFKVVSNQFVVGTGTDVDWIVGTIGSTTLKVKGERVCLENGDGCPSPSSRRLKEKIKPFTNFNKALKDILKTPLFTYRYKKDSLKKDRMGIISEELPISLQVKEKGKLSRPDWVSVYGTFWAAIKALHHQLEEFKEEFSVRLAKWEKSFLEDLIRLRNHVQEFVKTAAQFQTQLSAGLEKVEKDLDFMGKVSSEVQKELSETKQKLGDTQQRLGQAMESQKFLLEENNKLKTELSTLKERVEDLANSERQRAEP